MNFSSRADVLRHMPAGLTTFRLALVPAIVLGAWIDAPGWMFVAALTLAFWADVFDGVLARALGVATPALRRYDSLVDILHYLAVVAAIGIQLPEVLWSIRWRLAGLVALEFAAESVCWWRFRQTCATHTWSCKVWGIVLWLATSELLGLKRPTPLLDVALLVGYVALAEVVLIHLVARRVPVDVPSIWHLPQSTP
jgi:CDP-diacylglycerol--glycerol-3-phosphate 3-phosphatidyltransferase